MSKRLPLVQMHCIRCKTGGAFMKTLEDAEALAHAMVRIGNNVGRNTMAIISDMNQPLGRACELQKQLIR